MKQFLFLILLTLIGTVGAFAVSPFWGIAVYYLFAVLRPQYVWDWALLDYDPQNKIRWSFYVAVAAILAAFAHKLGFIRVAERDQSFSRDALAERVPIDQHPTGPFTSAHVLLLAFGAWIGVSYLGCRLLPVLALILED